MPLVPIIKIVRPFYLFMSVSFELWVYWYAKGKKKQAYVQLFNQPFFSQSTLSDLSESLWHNYNLSCDTLFVEKYLFLAEETLQSLKGGERKGKREENL